MTDGDPDERAPHLVHDGHMDTLRPVETFTVGEMARAWKLSERTVRRFCAEGRLPHHRLGDSIRFTPADLERIDVSTLIAPEPAPAPSLATTFRVDVAGGQRPSTCLLYI